MTRAGAALIIVAAAGLLGLLGWQTLRDPGEPSRARRESTERSQRPERRPVVREVPDDTRTAAPPPEDPGPRSEGPALFLGRVLSLSGGPVAGARVYITPPETVDIMPGDVTAFTVTSETGEFRLVPPVGRHDVVVIATGYVPAFLSGVPARPGVRSDLGTISLDPGLSIQGRVVDQKGVGVDPAEVVGYRGGGFPDGGQLPGRAMLEGWVSWPTRCRTDSEGGFHLNGIIGREEIKLVARGITFAMEGDPVTAVPGATDVTLVVRRLRLATGRVTTGAVEPGDVEVGVAGATVRLEIRDPGGVSAFIVGTLEDGRFAFDLTDEKYEDPKLRFDVLVSADGFENLNRRDLLLADLLPAAELRLPLVRSVPQEPGRLRGRVLYDTGNPFRGTLTLSFGREGQAGRVFRSETDEEGRFLIEGIPPGEYVLRSAARQSRSLKETGQTLVITPGGEETVELNFERGGDVALTVTDDAGEPIPQAGVEVLGTNGRVTGTYTLEKGSIVLLDLAPGTHRIRVVAPGHRPAEQTATVERDRTVRLSFTLRAE